MNRYPWLDACLLSQAGVQRDYKVEWGWQRYLVGGKMFAAVCNPEPKYQTVGGHEIVTLKCDPALGELLCAQHEHIVPGFYMDKRNWISVFLDGCVPDEVLRDLCLRSYALVLQSLTKKAQREILSQPPSEQKDQ